jgi:hypothetical protein
MKFVLVLSAVSLYFSGCCTAKTQILPKGAHEASIISTSSEEDCAYKKAKEEGEEFCKAKGRKFIVEHDESEYRGMDKTAKGMMEGAGMAIGKPVHLSSSDDYKVKLKFKCVK